MLYTFKISEKNNNKSNSLNKFNVKNLHVYKEVIGGSLKTYKK